LLFIHGFTGSPRSLRELAERLLVQKGFSVELPRLPGHGTSVRDMARTRYTDWRAHVESTLAKCRKRGSSVILVGFSMGGTIALDVAAEVGDEIKGVVTINAPIERAGVQAIFAPLLARLPVVGRLPLPAAAAGLTKNDTKRPGVDERAYSWFPLGAGSSLVAQFRRLRSALAQIRVPVLVVSSREDHSVDPTNSTRIHQLLTSAEPDLLTLENSYHLAPLDYDQDTLVSAVTSFADRVCSLPRAPGG
jgi:carboxylesterase